jgi:NitT/TauT family transport system permease protein
MPALWKLSPRILAYQLGILVLVLVAWEVLTAPSIHLLRPLFFSRPSLVVAQLVDWFRTGYILPHIGITLFETVIAFILGALAGVAVGFVLARNRTLSLVFNPYVRMLNALPRVVLAPIFTLWLGLGVQSKIALGITLVFFIVFFNTYQGIREVDLNIINNARMLGATERQLTRHVLLPSAVTWILSSLHTSVGFALVGAVIGEYLGASKGLGYVIQFSESTFDSAGVFAGLAVLAVTVIVLEVVLTRVEDRLLVWKPERQREARAVDSAVASVSQQGTALRV